MIVVVKKDIVVMIVDVQKVEDVIVVVHAIVD